MGYDKAYGGKSRIQTDCYYNDSIFDLYYTFRISSLRTGISSATGKRPMEWFIIAEFWNNAGWVDEGHRFRIHLVIKEEEERETVPF